MEHVRPSHLVLGQQVGQVGQTRLRQVRHRLTYVLHGGTYVHIRFGHFSCLGISFSRSSELFLAIPSQGHAGGSSVHYRPCPELGGPSWRMWLTVKVAKTGSKPRGRIPRRQSLANLTETQQRQFKKIAPCLFISTSIHHSFADSTSP